MLPITKMQESVFFDKSESLVNEVLKDASIEVEAVASRGDGVWMQPEDIIEFQGKKFVILEIRRGTKWIEMKWAELEDPTRTWRFKTPYGETYEKNPKYKYIGKAKGKKQQEAIEKGREKVQEIREKKEEHKEKNRDMIEELGIDVGDVVEIRGKSYGNWQAIVGAVNHRDGRVALIKYSEEEWEEISREKAMKQYRMQQLEDQLGWLERSLYKKHGPRQFRWIPAISVAKVIKKAKDRFDDERSYPQGTVDQKYIAEMKEKGWAQIRYGSEFIENSYVIAIDPANARKGETYEVASGKEKIYYDKEQGFYWRETGSFD